MKYELILQNFENVEIFEEKVAIILKLKENQY